MKIEGKISGWLITDIDNIKPFERVMSYKTFLILPREAKDELVKHYWVGYSEEIFTLLDMDDAYKLAIYLNYPAELEQLQKAFGEKWYNYYLRFNH